MLCPQAQPAMRPCKFCLSVRSMREPAVLFPKICVTFLSSTQTFKWGSLPAPDFLEEYWRHTLLDLCSFHVGTTIVPGLLPLPSCFGNFPTVLRTAKPTTLDSCVVVLWAYLANLTFWSAATGAPLAPLLFKLVKTPYPTTTWAKEQSTKTFWDWWR